MLRKILQMAQLRGLTVSATAKIMESTNDSQTIFNMTLAKAGLKRELLTEEWPKGLDSI